MVQWLLFTWSRCSQCARLKPYVQQHINNGTIQEYDLDQIRSNAQLMRIFRSVSNAGHVPVLIMIDRGQIANQAVGVGPILNMIGVR